MTDNPNRQHDAANPEFLWMRLVETAISEFNSGRFNVAAENWRNAHRIAQDFNDHDPRLAGSLNNLGIAFRINHDFEEAERMYRSALKNWSSASHWVDRMQLRQRARSSLFHLRMERKYRSKYDNIVRRKYQQLLAAGQAVTLNNLAEVFHGTNRFKQAEQSYQRALRKCTESLDEPNYAVAIINANLAGLAETFNTSPPAASGVAHPSTETADFISRAARQGWIVDRPSEFTDEGRLMAAIYLTHLVDHRRLKPLRLKSDR